MRIQRDGKWCNVCLSDMTEEELVSAIAGKSEAWLRGALIHLADVIHYIGEEFDIVDVCANQENGEQNAAM